VSQFECWSIAFQGAILLVQVGTLIVLALTLWAVARYARDTERIKIAAIEQSEAVQKPCLMPETLTESAEQGGEKIYYLALSEMLFPKLTNIGPGPALNGKMALHNSDTGSIVFRQQFSDLSRGQTVVAAWWPGRGGLPTKSQLRATYESMSGKVYETEVQIEGTKVVRCTFRAA